MTTQTPAPTTSVTPTNGAQPTSVATNHHPTTATRLLAEAQTAIENRDYAGASQHLWDAANAALDAAGDARGWHPDGGRMKPWDVLDRLDDELGGLELFDLYGSAELLEYNVSERWIPEDEIPWHADQVRDLVRRVGAMAAR